MSKDIYVFRLLVVVIIRPYVKEGEKVIFKSVVHVTVHRDKFL